MLTEYTLYTHPLPVFNFHTKTSKIDYLPAIHSHINIYCFYSMRTQFRRTTDAFDSLSVRYSQNYRLPYSHTTSQAATQRERPLPGRSATYGGILHCSRTNKYAMVQGRKTGKWSFPKGHVNRYETPFECVIREVREETGITTLPNPQEGVPLGVGYYYTFTVPDEIPLMPEDVEEVQSSGWFTLNEMKEMRLNIDASTFVRQKYQMW